MLETLIVPLRRSDRSLADRHESILTRSRGVHCAEVSREIVREAAHLRATSGIQTPDALQMATALHFRATAFITNDRRLQSVPAMRTLQLDDYR
jgi:predicted nucleic acid-binding protein